MTTLERITSFANMILSVSKIHKTIEQEEAEMRLLYIGKNVTEKLPNGSIRQAVVMQVDFCPSCGINGNFLFYICYSDEKTLVPGCWCDLSVLTFSGGNE